MPLISIITPCYNHGEYLDELVDSIQLDQNRDIFELIVINDGSTDAFTIAKLEELSSKGITVLHQENQGLAAARNNGISKANGEYILPLDSDNKIVPDVFAEAAAILDNNNAIDVVYTDAIYFGEREGKWEVGEFNWLELLQHNFIDACALIRKSALLDAGLYDGAMPGMGSEDWELWVNFFLHGKQFYYLPKAGFYYRVVKQSMSVATTRPNLANNKKYIYNKHLVLIWKQYDQMRYQIESMKDKINFINHLTFFQRVKVIIKLVMGKKILY